MKTLVINATVISPGVELENASVEICDGVIKAVYPAGSVLPSADKTIDAEGRMLMPGFIDIHTHGANGADVTHGKPDSLAIMAEAKLREGVTTFLPTTLTLPHERLQEVVANAKNYMDNPTFAKAPYLHIEGPFINPKCTGAQNPAFVVEPNIDVLLDLHNIAPARIVSMAPEMPNAEAFIREATARDITVSAAHTAATRQDMAKAKAAGLTHLTHFCNQMSPLHHREIGVVGTGLLDGDLKIELICDTIHLCRDMLELVFTLKPIDQLMLITDSMEASWMADGEINFAGLPVTIKDSIARVTATGALAGSTLKFNEGLRNVYEITGMPLSELVKATSWNQAQSLGLEKIGKIAPGFVADIVLLNEDFSVWQTLVDGVCK